MKNKIFFNSIVATLITVIFSVLAGCASTPSEGANNESAAARRLATDLNTMNGGSVTVNGNTVTLNNNIGVRRNLIVPNGVTLDLTGDSGLWLQDGITLTVNGTVNTPSNRIGCDGSTNARSVTINGTGTINLKSKGRLLNIDNGKILTLDGITLIGLTDNDSPLVGVNEGGELIMKGGTITGYTRNVEGSGGGGVHLWRGTFTMFGGEIYGNSSKEDVGGILAQYSTFTMKGGTISDNSGKWGGGVAVQNDSRFIMEGGEISGNINDFDGGGVFVYTNTVFTMIGGVIYGNTAANRGGGVFVVNNSMFTMEGGRIQGGTTSDGFAANIAQNGASLRVNENATASRWGMGGTYTKGGVLQTGGSDIGNTNDTLIAIP